MFETKYWLKRCTVHLHNKSGIIKKTIIYEENFVFIINTCVGNFVGSCPRGLQSFSKYIIRNPTVALIPATMHASITFNHLLLIYLQLNYTKNKNKFAYH